MKKLILYMLLGISINCHASLDMLNDEELTTDDSALENSEFKSHKTKKICKLCTECLTVTQSLKVNGSVTINPPTTRALATALTVNGPKVVNGTLNVTDSLLVNEAPLSGATGATGPAGTFSASSYGQFSVSSQSIAPVNNSWTKIPFNSAGPSSNMEVSTTSPATITVLQAGTYQLNVHVYFLTQYPFDESIYTPVGYQLGLSTNGGSSFTPVTAVYADEYNERYALNYSVLIELSAYEALQFAIEAVSNPGFINTLLLETGNASLTQIST